MSKELTPLEKKLLQGYGVKVENPEDLQVLDYKPKAQSRADVRRKYTSTGELSPKDAETFQHVLEVFGTTETSTIQPLSEEEIDFLADEITTIRSVQDILQGRADALRTYIFDTINQQLESDGRDPKITSGYITSPEYGVKLSKEVSGGKLTIDPILLKEVLDEERFASVTNMTVTSSITYYPDGSKKTSDSTTYEINEEALEKQLTSGNIGIEEILKAAKEGTRKTAFYVRKSD